MSGGFYWSWRLIMQNDWYMFCVTHSSSDRPTLTVYPRSTQKPYYSCILFRSLQPVTVSAAAGWIMWRQVLPTGGSCEEQVHWRLVDHKTANVKCNQHSRALTGSGDIGLRRHPMLLASGSCSVRKYQIALAAGSSLKSNALCSSAPFKSRNSSKSRLHLQ